MNYKDLLNATSDLSCFSTQYLAAGQELTKIRLQLNRWVRSGKVLRIAKGLYTLPKPYQKISPHPFPIANQLKTPSYVSLHSALAWHSMIPEYTPMTTSVTTSRPQTIETPLGYFQFRHISKRYFWGYQQILLSSKQTAFVARPEKALLDLLHLTPQGNDLDYLRELRLQNLDKINLIFLQQVIDKLARPKFRKVTELIKLLIKESEHEMV